MPDADGHRSQWGGFENLHSWVGFSCLDCGLTRHEQKQLNITDPLVLRCPGSRQALHALTCGTCKIQREQTNG